MTTAQPFHESGPFSTPIREMGLTIEGTWLEPVLKEFEQEVENAGVRRVKPRFYLSNEWGVSDSLAIGVPFYLARPELIALQAERVGHVEGGTRSDILRYLRHELGHVICYAYRLHDDEEWVKVFGASTQPYLEEYRVEPFSRRFVRHLPGWYAQKHPEEDWCETLAVWMTPGLDWRSEYAHWPAAMAKLEYTDRTMKALGDREPLATSTSQEDDIANFDFSVDEFYRRLSGSSDEILTLGKIEFPPGLDGALRTIFEDVGEREDKTSKATRKPASSLIHQYEQELLANIYRWTGHFPERARPLLRHLAHRADDLKQVYPEDRATQAVVALTTLVTALAMNYAHHGTYLP